MSQPFNVLLAEIARLLEESALSDVEMNRSMRDLTKIRHRLASREYERSSFSTNTFCVAERARDTLAEVRFYAALGRRWAAILSAIGVTRRHRILDVAPGFTPKVELGLLYSGFDKTVVAVDKDADALGNLRQFVELFNPPFVLETVVADFLDASIEEADVVTANHALDDVVAEHYCRTRSIDCRAAYLEERRFRELWLSILAEKDAVLDEVHPRLASALARLVGSDGALVVVQYPSHLERLLGLEMINDFCHELFSRSMVLLELQGFKRDRETPARVLTRSELFGPESCYLLFRR